MTEKMVRLVVMLPRPVLQELERVATAQGLSRSGLIRVVMIRYIRDQAEDRARREHPE